MSGLLGAAGARPARSIRTARKGYQGNPVAAGSSGRSRSCVEHSTHVAGQAEATVRHEDRAVDVDAGVAEEKESEVDDVGDSAEAACGDGVLQSFARVTGEEAAS